MSPRTTPSNTVRVSRPRNPQPVADIQKHFLAFTSNWRTATQAGKARDKASAVVKAWFSTMGDSDHEVTVNDAGSRAVEFDEPILVDGMKVTGLENVRRESSELDLDLVDDLLDSLPEAVRKRVVKKVVEYVTDPNELFKLNQEGVISDEQLDALFTTDVTWALCVKKD
jgi:hypothetical protein